MRRKRSRSSKVLFFLSVVLAVGTTLVLRGHLLRLEARAVAAGPGAPTVFAEIDLVRGSVIEEGDVQLRSVPSEYRPPGALESVDQVAGRMLAADVAAGEALTAPRLAARGGPVAAMVPPGLRAVPVPVAFPSGVLASGDRVDVLATFAAGQPHSEVVVTEAEVLSILSAEGTLDGTTHLILLVTPDDAERLAYARSFAELSIAVTPSGSFP